MALSLRAKRGLIAFGIFDVAVIIALIFLFVLRSEINLKDELRDIGVTVFPDIRPIQEFELVDQNFESFTSDKLKDQWTILFFGFTSCPDICPITMAELKKFYEQLNPSLKDNLNVLMVSVDPERDDPETIGKYVNGFNQEFLGITGSVESIAGVASQFFVGYSEPVYESENGAQKQNMHQHGQNTVEQPRPELHHSEAGHSSSNTPTENYLISHSGHIAIVNPDGNYHAVMRPPHRVKDLLKAYEMMLESSKF
jgi:protein SCO1/2